MILNSSGPGINILQGCSIGVTSGCFDMLHALHVEYLTKCRKACDILFVMVDSDMLIKKNKGILPVINERDRAYLVDQLKPVDGVLIIDNLKEYVDFVENLATGSEKDVIIFKNDTTIYGIPLIEISGAINVHMPDINRFSSTSEIINHLKER